MSQHKYTFVGDSNVEDKKSVTIRKSNVDVDFTAHELEGNERAFRKNLKEWTAQKELADAKMKNIEAHHPFVMDLSEEQCFTVHMYMEAKSMSRVLGKKIPELVEEIAYIEAEKKDITEQTGIEFTKQVEDPKAPVTGEAPQVGEQATNVKEYACQVDGEKWSGVDVPDTCPKCGGKGSIALKP